MDPPRFRAGSWDKACKNCEHFRGLTKDGEWGTCAIYGRPMRDMELCDSWRKREEKAKA
jgi:hypothetical protein